MKKTNLISTYIFIILSFTPLVLLPIHNDYYYMPKLMFVYGIFAFILSRWLIYEKNKHFLIESQAVKFLLIYLVLVLFSTIFSDYFYLALWGNVGREEGLLTLILYGFLFLFSRRYFFITDKKINIILIVAAIVSALTIMQYFNFNPLKIIYPYIFISSKTSGTIGFDNFLGSYLVLLFPIPVWMYLKSGKIQYIFFMSLIYSALILSHVRNAWLGSFAGFLVLLFLAKNTQISYKRILSIVLCLGILTVFLNQVSGGILLFEFDRSVQEVNITVSSILEDEADGLMTNTIVEHAGRIATGRVYIWDHTIDLILEKPVLGWGPDTFGEVFGPSLSEEAINNARWLLYVDKAHNEYLQIAYASGIPALIFYLIFIFSVLKKAWKNIKGRTFIIPLFCSIVGYLVQAFFNISVVSVAYIFWIFMGALVYLSNNKINSTNEDFC